MSHKQYESYAQYLLDKNSGDVELTKKIVSNAASISKLEGDTEAFNRESEVLQHIEVLTAN